jgi:hypothetical protein
MHLEKSSDKVVHLDQIWVVFDDDQTEDPAALGHTFCIGGQYSAPPATVNMGYARDAQPSPPDRPGRGAPNAPWWPHEARRWRSAARPVPFPPGARRPRPRPENSRTPHAPKITCIHLAA